LAIGTGPTWQKVWLLAGQIFFGDINSFLRVDSNN